MGHNHSNELIRFPFDIRWSESYDNLFRGKFEDTTSPEEVLRKVRKRGRGLLCGKGGSGKTTVAHRILTVASKTGVTVTFIDMRLWSAKLLEAWEGLTDDPLFRADFVLRNFGSPTLSLAAIDELPGRQEKLIVLDGLNEIRSSVGQQLLVAFDRLAAVFSNLSVLVTDRLVRRDITEERWAIGLLLSLSEETAKKLFISNVNKEAWDKATQAQRRILEIPFFLDKALQDRQITSATIEGYLIRHALPETEVPNAARGAFITYREGFGGRSFPLRSFTEAAGSPATKLLLESGILVNIQDDAYFTHHLFHDFLAARHLAAHSEDWGAKAFDAVTFDASSFDAIAEVLGQLSVKDADRFIRKVYDWNPYAAAYAISEASERHVSDEMTHVITAALAERRWDLVVPTVVRTQDALAVLGTSEARKYLEAGSFDEVIMTVAAIESKEAWFRDWQQLFVRRSSEGPKDRELSLLESDDSIFGWTAANVLRRLHLTDAELQRVREIAGQSQSVAVRWRATHVLGAFPKKENQDTLLDRLLNDQDEWVRYGALRSLMEMAARSSILRSDILETLANKADTLITSKRLIDEFSRAARARVDKEGIDSWMRGLGRVFRALILRAKDPRELERWSRLSHELDEQYTN